MHNFSHYNSLNRIGGFKNSKMSSYFLRIVRILASALLIFQGVIVQFAESFRRARSNLASRLSEMSIALC